VVRSEGRVQLPGEEAETARAERARLVRAATRLARALGVVAGGALRAAVNATSATLDEIADKVERLD
jgi:hypothetical protein